MRIQHGLPYIGIHKKLKTNSRDKRKSLTKLSSGKKVNNAADDVAGLVISEKMYAQIRGLRQAKRNASDTLSALQVVDGGLGEVTDILQRMRELSIQASSDTLSASDRLTISAEYEQIKTQIDRISKDTNFNTKRIYEEHFPIYQTFTGNRVLDDQLTVVKDLNDKLGIRVDGNLKTVYLDEGIYNRVDFVDMLDDKLWDVDKNIIPHIDENNVITLSAEDYHHIDGITGGAAGFFYEYHIGSGPGVVYGTSDLSGNLDIISGSNDVFTFTMDGKRFEVKFQQTPKPHYMGNGYTADKIVEIMQEQLDEQNANIKVYMNGNHIALDPGLGMIEGFGGNMVKIDGITSILYDNAKHGIVNKTQGYVQGRVPIKDIVIEKDVNDTIAFYLDKDTDKKEIILDEGTYENADELANKINEKLEAAQIKAYAISVGDKIALYSKSRGSNSKVRLDTSCSSYDTLFKYTEKVTTEPKNYQGKKTNAYIVGRPVLGEKTNIVKGQNDTIKLLINEEEKNIVLSEGEYSPTELKEELNRKLKETNVTASVEEYSSKYRIRLTHKYTGDGASIKLDTSCNAYKPLFCRSNLYYPTYTAGKTVAIPPQEGSTKPTYEYKPAKLEGRNFIDNLNINEKNDELILNVSGEKVSIKIKHGTYTAESLKNELQNKIKNAKMDNLEVTTKYNRIHFTTKKAGNGQSISVSGSAYRDIFVSEEIDKPFIEPEKTTHSYILGQNVIEDKVLIDSSNNILTFDYFESDGEKKIDITLEEKGYLLSELVDELNNKLDEIFQDDPKIIAKEDNGRIKLVCQNAGSKYYMKNFSGGFYDKILTIEGTRSVLPYYYNGWSNSVQEQECYIVGRKDISSGVTINPNINDTLTFDIKHNNIEETITVKLTPGIYTPEELTNEINNKLEEQNIDYVRAEYGSVDAGTTADDTTKLVLRYNTSENGNYVIDGVRGNSAYSLFYNATGEPTPTHTVGVVKLDKGAVITKGKNDTFIFDVNGEERTIVLSEGKYTQEELLDAINKELENVEPNIAASYYEDRLKLSYKEIGFNTIDNIRGNARDTLFFGMKGRDKYEYNHYQIGANTEDNIVLDPVLMSAGLLRINTTNIQSKKAAQKSLIRIDHALSKISEERGRIGAYQNRFEHMINNLENTSQNLQSAKSRITDVDMAKEALNLIKHSILEQTSIAVFAQANSTSKMVLKLLEWKIRKNPANFLIIYFEQVIIYFKNQPTSHKKPT